MYVGITGIILCGGKSVRMGQNKALLELGGMRVIERVIDVMGRIFPTLLLVANTPGDYAFTGVETVRDVIPEGGSLVGLYTGLRHVKTDKAFAVACDMPFLNEALIRRMADSSSNEDALIPRTLDGLQPLHALYSASCVPTLAEVVGSGEKRIRKAFEGLTVREFGWDEISPIDPEGRSFMNVNTPQEWERALAIAGETA
ncbi:MAG: molybdenum cofactor guanylyltransferase [Nitrospirota bacterium]|nr:molybdenum cofactor guanylyltransferase [Nitrospirota bacterium]